MASKNQNLNGEGWKYILLEGQWSDRAASNRCRFEEPNFGLGGALNHRKLEKSDVGQGKLKRRLALQGVVVAKRLALGRVAMMKQLASGIVEAVR